MGRPFSDALRQLSVARAAKPAVAEAAVQISTAGSVYTAATTRLPLATTGGTGSTLEGCTTQRRHVAGSVLTAGFTHRAARRCNVAGTGAIVGYPLTNKAAVTLTIAAAGLTHGAANDAGSGATIRVAGAAHPRAAVALRAAAIACGATLDATAIEAALTCCVAKIRSRDRTALLPAAAATRTLSCRAGSIATAARSRIGCAHVVDAATTTVASVARAAGFVRTTAR